MTKYFKEDDTINIMEMKFKKIDLDVDSINERKNEKEKIENKKINIKNVEN